jgi:flavin-dependent dehydrogenase
VDPITSFDVLIVGAGPAGTSTWLHLQKYAPALAEKTVLIEKALFPRHKLCAGGVGGWSDAIFDDLDLKLDIPSLVISDIEFRFRDQNWIHHSPKPFRMVQRADFDMALARAAVKRGMAFHENEAFIAAKRERDRLLVRTSHATFYVKALIGADGALSAVRRTMMPPRRRSCLARTIQISAPVNPQYDTEFSNQRVLMDFSAVDRGLQGYTWHFPCLQDEKPFMNHGIGDTMFLRDRPRADLKKIFSRELKARNINTPVEAWSSHPSRWFSYGEPIAIPNVLLVGDAAGIDPAFGGGIQMALSYGEIAAMNLRQAFQNEDFSFEQYNHSLMTHFMGGHIGDCTRLARRIYGGREDPLDLVRQFFTGRFGKRNLLSLLRKFYNWEKNRPDSQKPLWQ